MALHRARRFAGLLLLALAHCSRSGGSDGVDPDQVMPAGWSSQDIGAVGWRGAASYKSGVYSLAASGADIWDTADAFRFHYRLLSGDGEMTARVIRLDPTDAWAKAGVMIRESLAPGSTFAMTVVTPSNGVTLQYRTQTDQGCGLTWGPQQPAPTWVRIQRTGSTFTGSASPDGVHWTTIGSLTIAMGVDVYIGLCATAHNNTASTVASFEQVAWTGLSPTTPPPAALPELGPDMYLLHAGVHDVMHATLAGVYVQVVDPAALDPANHAPAVTEVTATPSTVAPFGTVQLAATASDADGDPLRFAWIVTAGETTCSATSAETWRAPSQPGTYTLTVLATDGEVWSRGTVAVTVTGPSTTTGVGNHAPAIRSLTSDVVRVAPGGTVQLALEASDIEGNPLESFWTSATGGTIAANGWTATWTAPSVAGSGRPAKAGLWIWNRFKPAGCPFEMSTAVPGIAFVGRASVQHFCDTWMPTWAADGDLYSPWQDGVLLTPPFENLGGWHAGDPTALNGWAKIHGDDPQDLLIPAAGEVAGPKGAWSGRYPAAMFHHDGVLYYGVRSTAVYDPAGNLSTSTATNYRYSNGTFIGFYTSPDGGATWSSSPNPDAPLFPEPTGGNQRLRFGQPYMVDFGRNQQHSPDGKVYFVSSGSTGSDASADHLNDDSVFLCRVTPSIATINQLSAYEFWAGGSAWSHAIQDAQPLFTWKNHVSGATATWNPGLGKFVMWAYKNGYTLNGTECIFGEFDTYVLEADALTGPWRLVHYLPSFGKQGYYPNLPSKFLSADGRDAWLWYGANFSPWDREADPPGSGYKLCEQRIRFLSP